MSSLWENVNSHPTGNMLTINEMVLFSYICPLNDPQHHACIMMWSEKTGIQPWLNSDHPASDWMISPAGEGKVYLIERYYQSENKVNMCRLLEASIGDRLSASSAENATAAAIATASSTNSRPM